MPSSPHSTTRRARSEPHYWLSRKMEWRKKLHESDTQQLCYCLPLLVVGIKFRLRLLCICCSLPYLMLCPVTWLVSVVGWCWLEVNVFCFLFSVPETRCAIVCFREKAKRFWIDCGRTFLFLDLCNKGNH